MADEGEQLVEVHTGLREQRREVDPVVACSHLRCGLALLLV